jgi:hypothetical protein
MRLGPTNVRRGMMSVVAMLYLILFSVMAVGFYATVGVTTQTAYNDIAITQAQYAAETGVEFARHQLGRVSISPTATGSTVTNELYSDLQTLLNNTANLGGKSVSKAGAVISIPSGGDVRLDSNGRMTFNVTVTDWPQQGKVVVRSTGTYDGVSRSIQLDFTRVPRHSSVFDFAVASRGQIVLDKGEVTTVNPGDAGLATAMSALVSNKAIRLTGGALGGKITILAGADAELTRGTVDNTSSMAAVRADHMNVVDEPPEFPTVDPTAYRQYATNTYSSGAHTQTNIRIPANTGTPSHPVTFNANDTVQGILYIESPNSVKFNGNFNLKGILVMAASTAGESSTDGLDFRGNFSQLPLPSGSQFDAIRAASGVSMLAPTANVTMSGSVDSLMRGNVIVNTFNFNGSADIVVDHGTLMTMKSAANSAVFNGKTVKFTATGANNLPSVGVSFSRNYVPDAASYEELLP